jgi:glutathione S-transferase
MAASGFTLYGFWLSGPSYKAALMFSLGGIKFGFKSINLQQGANKTPEYLALNRYGQVPTLKHGELVVVQSNVILDYLSELSGKFRGHDKASVLHAKEWLAWEADRLAPNVYRTRFYKRFAPDTDANVVKAFNDSAAAALKVLDGALAKGPFLVGKDAGIADIGCWAPVAFLEEAGFAIDSYPHIKAWSERLTKLPGFKLPYDLMPKEDVAA